MKKLIYTFCLITILSSCMNTTERKITADNKPGDYFEGKQLKMAQAIYDRNINEIARLITVEHFDVNGRGVEPKYTYLGYAVLINAVPAAASLLKNGADVNAPSIQTNLGIRTNISIACDQKNQEMIKLLIAHHADLNPKLSASPLNGLVINNADKSLIDLLITEGANVNHRNYVSGTMPVFTALDINRFDLITYFLEKGADPLRTDYKGNSLAFLIQSDLDEGNLNGDAAKKYADLKHELETTYHVTFPVKREARKGLEAAIQAYESLPETDKKLLGERDLKRYEKDKDNLIKGVDGFGNPL